MFAIVKTKDEADKLNDYIKDGYYNEVENACFDKWSEVFEVKNGFAIEILNFMMDRPVPSFIVNGISFAEVIEIDGKDACAIER